MLTTTGRHGARLRQGFSATWNDVTRLLNRNRIFIERTRNIGVLSREDAINMSVTGPIARASGVVRDLRKDEPYLAYNDFDFKVSVPTQATVTLATWCAWKRCWRV